MANQTKPISIPDGKQGGINEGIVILLLGITIVLVIMNTTMFNLALLLSQRNLF